MANAPHTVPHKVAVPAEEVRKSGLLKDRILIHHPEAATTAEMALLEEAARRWGQMTLAWGRIARTKRATVWPVLVVQVENGTDRQLTKTDLVRCADRDRERHRAPPARRRGGARHARHG
jgi:type III restriction enzyme